MKTAIDVAHKYLGFFAPRHGWTIHNSIIQAMEEYAKIYHESEVNKLSKAIVSFSCLAEGNGMNINLKEIKMNADLVGALEQLNKSWKAFEHKGKPMTKEQVRKALVYGIKKGYKHTGELTDEDIDSALAGN